MARFNWHSLRHCFVSHAFECGLSLLDVSRLVGHSTLSVTEQIYLHMLPDSEAGQRERLGALFQEKVKQNVSRP